MVGLQGSGKTTTTAKIAKKLSEKDRKKVLMASLDVNRPAAQEQLAVLGSQIGVVLAAMLVKSMEMEMLKWLVAFIVIYTSWTMYASWRAARRPTAQLAADIAG